ncbi:MAG TPA: RtcB family protein [Anaerolineales bacterium]|nr:RtcB family protein [Anaerolineales bacterium]
MKTEGAAGPPTARDLVRQSPFQWEIPRTFRRDMRVPVRLFADERLIEGALSDASLTQAVNAATLPGLVSHVTVMPDVHQGYGFPIGGVAATRLPDGVISPGAIGYDINCGVRLLASEIPFEQAAPLLPRLAGALYAACPSGVGVKGNLRLTEKDLDRVCRDGAGWAERLGFTIAGDLSATEEDGRIDGADPAAVSPRARERGRPQLGTLGAGNHFVEVDVVDRVFHGEAARAMGLQEGALTLQIHCGSRGFGHQICSDYVDELQSAVTRYGIDLPDRELVCAPLNSPEGRRYLAAMACAANFAFANRQILAHQARSAFRQVFGDQPDGWLRQVYDIAHNMGKIEDHRLGGESVRVCVHRKGATRAFGPGFAGLPPRYRHLGQPVLVPGSMGTASWVLLGTEGSMALAFGSTCHGAGRRMSRHQAKRSIRGDRLRQEMEERGIHVRAGSLPGLAEEAPQAYKDVDAVVEVVVGAGIAARVARLRPLAVIKG